MPNSLMDALRSFAKAASLRSPDLILAEHEARQPKPRPFWWTK